MKNISGLFVGVAVLDTVFHIDSPVVQNGKKAAYHHTIAAGGNAANAAVVFASPHLHDTATPPKTTLLTRLGVDNEAEIIKEELSQHGVDVHSLPGAENTIHSSIVVNTNTGDRFIVSSGGSGSTTPKPPCSAGLSPQGYDVVLVDGHHIDIAAPIAKEARQLGIPVIADGDLPNETTEELLQLSDVAIVSAEYLNGRSFTDVAHGLLDSGVSYIAATHGGDAIEACALGTFFLVDIPKIDNVLCTLGAGDFFHGAFCRHIAENPLSTPDSFKEALEYSSAIAGKSIASLGTRTWLNPEA